MGVQAAYPRLSHLLRVPINFNTSGDHILIPADPINRIVIHRLWFVCGAAVNITFKDNLLSPAAVPMSQGGALVFDTTGEPWFITDPNMAFIINSDQAVQISGEIRYLLAI